MRGILAAALAFAACVTPEPAADPRGAVHSGQRLIVMVYQSPGPWIVADPDSKAETAIKLLPIGGFLQGMQEDRVNELSKEIQPYLPRPHYGEAVERALIAALKAGHDGPVQTSLEAGIDPRQRRDWNAAADQLDWRHKYYAPEPGRSARDYSKLLSLDDAVIVEVNLSFGLAPDDQERTLPILNAATRLYRADTSRQLWSREDALDDKTSSSTLTEFRASPSDLTDRLYAMATPLGTRIGAELSRTLMLKAPLAPPSGSTTTVVSTAAAVSPPPAASSGTATSPAPAPSPAPSPASPPAPSPSTATAPSPWTAPAQKDVQPAPPSTMSTQTAPGGSAPPPR